MEYGSETGTRKERDALKLNGANVSNAPDSTRQTRNFEIFQYIKLYSTLGGKILHHYN